MKPLSTLAQNIRYLRLAKGWSQEAASVAAGMTRQHYQDIEAGRRTGMRLSTIEKLADAFKVEIWELFKANRFPAPKAIRGRSGIRIKR